MSETDERDDIYSATLIITGDDLEPDDVTLLLELAPSQAWRRGEKRVFDSGSEHIYEWGGWKLWLDDEKKNLELEDQLAYWCELLEAKREVLHDFVRQGYWVRLDCYISTSSIAPFRLEWELQKKLVELGADLDFHVLAYETAQPNKSFDRSANKLAFHPTT
jgi:hypothetical protein